MKIALPILLLFFTVCVELQAVDTSEPVGQEGSFIEMRLQELRDYRSRLHRWDRIILGFRQGHNFAIALSSAVGNWRKEGDESVGGKGNRNSLKLSYSYYIKMVRGFGYVLGSQTSLPISDSTKGTHAETYRLPGARVGLAWSPTAAVRFELTAGVHLMRIERFESALNEVSNITATARGSSVELAIDIFLNLNQGLRMQYESHRFEVEKVLNVGLRREEKSYSFGWVYHLI